MADNGTIKIDSKAAAKRIEDAPKIAIFEIDGHTYEMADAARADIGLDYINRVITDGEDAATAQLVIDTMGEDAFQALREVDGLDPDDWRAIMAKVQAVVTPKARTNRTGRRA